ncbi:hypothetical protein OJAV_G00077860 [Oryzias javanicus]|uniref:Uncharacterized protein n=1 Tax=Oryzias javanicus TaxID=123683 RepID=A0A437D2Z0_ORYJA|nr:hypothetical protein OJAV_G00077860 [Oryzias javanicus]
MSQIDGTETHPAVMDNSTDEYRIQSFDPDTQMLLKTALKDPSSVDLEKVTNIIVDQSLKDHVFSKEAGVFVTLLSRLRPSKAMEMYSGETC